MAAALVSFDEAKNVLKMEDRELHAMVSRGELRAFRDQGVLKFRREDIEKLLAARGAPTQVSEDAGKTFIATPATAAKQSLDFEQPDRSETGTIPSIELVGEEEAEAIEAIKPAIGPAGTEDKTQTVELPLEGDQTAELSLVGEEAAGTETLPLAGQEETAGVETVSEAAAQPTVTAAIRRRQFIAPPEEEEVHPGMTALLAASVIVLLVGATAIIGGVLGFVPDGVRDLFIKLIKPPLL